MNIRIRYFAAVREHIGHAEETLDTAATTLGELRDQLIARGGAAAEALARGKAVRIAFDHEMTDDEATPLRDGAEVAFFPPVTGG
ncbi:MAG: molybdopterin converting factor subunit 1 [Pseudomonadota bacterium]|nr:molybdopterin converting factor subunit 1 [Pseudomonadota bacterium]